MASLIRLQADKMTPPGVGASALRPSSVVATAQPSLTRRRMALAAAHARPQSVQTELPRLIANGSTSHGPNWEARRTQAAALLKQAVTADEP
jgi:hypothetical protein